MNIRFLETAIWLAELRSFRATADKLNMSPAAISNRITAIEHELAVRLFERDTRDIKLTAEGALFVERSKKIVDDYSSLIGALKRPGSIAGVVRIGLVPGVAMTIFPLVFKTLRESFPQITVSLTTDSNSTILTKLDEKKLDIVFGTETPSNRSRTSVSLCKFGMFWVANPAKIEIDTTEPLGKRELSEYPIISYEFGTINHRRTVEYFADTNSGETLMHYSNSLATTISMVVAGIGIAVVPPILIQNELRSGSLQVLKTKTAFPAADYFAVYGDTEASRLSSFIASLACRAADEFCSLYDDSLAASRVTQP
ncbi:LysR family transcriptional regulator [Arvimicrobium flavum]|uniref:LysR family transcriptional regulator n=1 Tax=Arvimicrobium flavum TaxID=3393320 RepID=UPI00237C088A|nr:LysR family transcriptional regulator [Mesorhizobium shangrilense]